MSKCENCIHYEVCVQLMAQSKHQEKDFVKEYLSKGKGCIDHFKDKSLFVEVVRCKDCSVPHNKWTGCPNLNGLIPPPDFYCAKGKRNNNKDYPPYCSSLKSLSCDQNCAECEKEFIELKKKAVAESEV